MSSVTAGRGLRDRKKAQTRAAFVAAATALFAQRGYEAVTVEDICAEVGVSPRTFFRYFSAKADLLVAAVNEMLQDLLEDLQQRPESEPPWTSLRQVLLAAADRIAGQRAQYLSLAAVTKAAPELVAGNAGAFIRWEQQMSAEVERRLDPTVRDRARLLTGVALTGFRVGIDAWVADGGHSEPRELVDYYLRLVEAAGRRIQKPAP